MLISVHKGPRPRSCEWNSCVSMADMSSSSSSSGLMVSRKSATRESIRATEPGDAIFERRHRLLSNIHSSCSFLPRASDRAIFWNFWGAAIFHSTDRGDEGACVKIGTWEQQTSFRLSLVLEAGASRFTPSQLLTDKRSTSPESGGIWWRDQLLRSSHGGICN